MYIHRDISWLSFNYRVLQEAKDPSVPILERLKFLAIYSSNLDEFFRVRVASIRSLLRSGKKARQSVDFDPVAVHSEILRIVNKQQQEISVLFQESIVPELARNGIELLRPEQLDESQRGYVNKYFEEQVARYVQPIVLIKQKIRPFLINGALYLAVGMSSKGSSEHYALVRIPSGDTARFVPLPATSPGKFALILLDDIVRFCLPKLFPGYDIKGSHSFKLTRDAELYIDDEYSGDLVEKIQKGLSKRNSGPPTRFIFDRNMPRKKLNYLCGLFTISKEELLPEGRYHNKSDFMKFPDFGMRQLKEASLPPLEHHLLRGYSTVTEAVSGKNLLAHFPFQTYDYVVRFFEEAAADPTVTQIKITQYRVAKRSRIMEALQKAAKAGKKVTAFVEIKARFDEEANLQWAEQLEHCGVRVLYSLPGIKVHAKLALVTRRVGRQEKQMAYLSTGNFNENTAKLYTDFGFFTSEPDYTREIGHIFNYLETGIEPAVPFKKLLVGRFNLFESITALIDHEIEAAKAGKTAEIIFKINSLEESNMVEKLYEASKAGVKVKLIVRGICCLVSGAPGLSENISARSIVDRYLEHSRIFIFHNGGKPRIFLSSADLMGRNLHHRIECAFPVTDHDLMQEIQDYVHIMLADNVKARNLELGSGNSYCHNNQPPLRAQLEMYHYYERALGNND